ncbi:HAD-IA family hydrolase [Tabrizicola sp.]|uniref:HAD-IA family hydrolase n=1 Tax=Tabrizicola sp. TaxID=2005166 RepID=UPI003F2FAE24
MTLSAPQMTGPADLPAPWPGIEALLFDAGDILYHRPGRPAVLKAFLERHAAGRPLDKAAVRALKLRAWRGEVPRKGYYRALLATAGIDDPAVLDKGATMLVAEQHRVAFFPGVAAALHGLRRAGYRLGIITNTHETTAEKLDWFAEIGIDGLWDVVVNSCETGFVKPEPEIYQTALTALGLRPHEAVFVAHSAKEVAGARAVGLHTIACNPDAPDIGADVTLTGLDGIAACLSPGSIAAARGETTLSGPGTYPVIAAHRGGALLWPENSMRAFRGAIGLHADMIETDLHLSSDGVPVIMHDPTLERTTHGTGAVRAHDLDSLRRVTLRGAEDEHIATLDEVLALIAPTEVDLRLEIKVQGDGAPYPGLEARVAASLRMSGMLERTTISSFAHATLVEFARICRPQGLIALIRSVDLEADGPDAVIARVQSLGIPEVAVSCRLVDADLIAAFKAAGLRIGAYGVRTKDDCDRMLSLPLSAFTTDLPDHALARRRAVLAADAKMLRPAP